MVVHALILYLFDSDSRGTHEWVDSLESEPSDWPELKEKLAEVMRKLYVERGN